MRSTLWVVDLELREEFDVFEVPEILEDFEHTQERERLLAPLT